MANICSPPRSGQRRRGLGASSLLLRKRTVSTKAALKLLDDANTAIHYNREILQTALDHVRQGIAGSEDLALVCWNRQFGEIFDLPHSLTRFGIALDEILRHIAQEGASGVRDLEDQAYIGASGGEVVGEDFIPFDTGLYEAYLGRIAKARPDAVLVSMVGNDCVTFNRAFAEAGFARRILRLSPASEENTLLGIGAENSENLFFAAGYMSGLKTDANLAFLERYQATFGTEAPVPNTIGELCYEGVRLYGALAARARSLDVAKLSRASEGFYVGARGPARMRKRHLHTDMYLAQADGLRFRLLRHFPH